jgi:hypothetical protein
MRMWRQLQTFAGVTTPPKAARTLKVIAGGR